MVNNILAALNGSNAALQNIQLQLATGKKVNRPNDDLASYGIARQAEASNRVNTVHNQVLDDVLAVLQTGIDLLTKMHSDALSFRNLASQAIDGTAAGTLTTMDLAAIDVAGVSIANAWNTTATPTYNYNGTSLLSATDLSAVGLDASGLNAFAGDGGGTGSPVVDFDTLAAAAFGGLTDTIADGSTPAGDGTLLAGVTLGGAGGGGVDDGIIGIETAIGRLESWQQQIQSAQATNTAVANAAENRRSFYEDVDLASASVESTKRTILQQVSVAQLAGANTASRQVLGLF